MAAQSSTLNMADGTALASYYWLLQTSAVKGVIKGVIVIAHGYGEHARRYDHVADHLNARGYAVYAADHRGHGRSRGDKLGYFPRFDALSSDLAHVIDWAQGGHGGAPLYLLGHSLGGLLAFYYALKTAASPVRGLIISNPFVNPSHAVPAVQNVAVRVLSQVAPGLKVVPRVASSALSRDPAVGKAYDADPDVYHEAISARVGVETVSASDFVYTNAARITLPLLMLIGTGDQIARPEFGLYMYDHVGSADKTLKKYEGFYHELLNEPEKEQIMSDIVAWLAGH